MLIVDAHLDLAHNAARGRDPREPASRQPVVDNEYATVGLPDLRSGGVELVCATIFCAPHTYRPTGYRTPDEARQQALSQLATYQRWADQGLITIVTDPAAVAPPIPQNQQTPRQNPIRCILLLEGADALRHAGDVPEWHARGLRVCGLAWRRTRAAGGTGEPGPITDEGKALVREFDRVGILHDASHLAERAFWDLTELTTKPILASHSNCRAIVPTDRQLSDEMIKAIAARGGVIGINFYDKFLLPPAQVGKRRATLHDVVAHVKHICDLLGTPDHVGIGTDMDGGLGREQIPVEITSSADLPRLADTLAAHGFSDRDILKIMGGNWVAFFTKNL